MSTNKDENWRQLTESKIFTEGERGYIEVERDLCHIVLSVNTSGSIATKYLPLEDAKKLRKVIDEAIKDEVVSRNTDHKKSLY